MILQQKQSEQNTFWKIIADHNKQIITVIQDFFIFGKSVILTE